MSITNLLEQVKDEEVVLPAIQRNFVWSKKKIEKLLDSIMRGYPIGIILLWETYNDIQHRSFVKDYKPGGRATFHDNDQCKRLKLVLDGQQRLQSLYIALYGTYEGKYLYFDMLSGRENEDFKEDKFIFRFLAPDEADEWNKNAASEPERTSGKGDEEEEASYYCRIQNLMVMGPTQKLKFRRKISKKLKLSEGDETRFELNLSLLRHCGKNDTSTKLR